MKSIDYPASITWSEEDQVFEVAFPDFSGCITFGATLEKAKAMASEALTGILESMVSRSIALPAPSRVKGKNIYSIQPSPSVSFALWLREKRKASGMTLTDVADKLGVKYQVYQRLEDPAKTNPTLKTIAKLEKVFGERLIAV
jgi:antitoxin HicB